MRIEDSIAAVASAFLGLGEAVKPHFGSFYIVCTLPFVCARLRLHIPFNLRLSLQHRVNHGRQNADGSKGHADDGEHWNDQQTRIRAHGIGKVNDVQKLAARC